MESAYSVIENIGVAQVVIVLSKPSATDVTIQIIYDDDTAIGK